MSKLINSSLWRKKPSVSINSLSLDPSNYRIPDAGIENLKSERDIIAKLVEIAGIEDLASRIVRQGFFPVEDVIVVEEEGKKVVVEGNRRLCACNTVSKNY